MMPRFWTDPRCGGNVIRVFRFHSHDIGRVRVPRDGPAQIIILPVIKIDGETRRCARIARNSHDRGYR